MTPEEFRAYGHTVVDWIADYHENIESFPVLSQIAPGDIAAALPSAPPESGEEFDAILGDVNRIVMPGITHWQHPSFFGYFPANASGPAILGDLLSSGLGVQGMLWATSPACTEVETVVVDWLAQLLDLPAMFRRGSAGGGAIQDSASSATLVATIAALHRASGGAVTTEGTRGRYTVYTSDQAHSSIEKAVRVAGIGTDNLRVLPANPDAFASAIDADIALGAIPALVVATLGTTSTGRIEPITELARICRVRGLWLHVDAAYAGAAAVCPELRWTHAGLDQADSYCMDPHKWLLTNFDCDVLWVSRREELVDALSVLPEYLRNAATESGNVVDYRDWQIPLGRRFRALKLWFVLRWYGAEGLRAHVRRHVALAAEFADWVRADERFELIHASPFGLVCFRLHGDDDANRALLERLNSSGSLYLTHTTVDGRFTIRMAIGGTGTERRHVEAAWSRITGSV